MEYAAYRRQLSSFSLVCSSWRAPAQDTMWRNMCLSASETRGMLQPDGVRSTLQLCVSVPASASVGETLMKPRLVNGLRPHVLYLTLESLEGQKRRCTHGNDAQSNHWDLTGLAGIRALHLRIKLSEMTLGRILSETQMPCKRSSLMSQART